MAVQYYALRGTGWDKPHPSGMFRVISDESSFIMERVDKKGNWIEDFDLIRHLAGYSDDAEEITKGEADGYLKFFKG
jgi:hypothetical protein